MPDNHQFHSHMRHHRQGGGNVPIQCTPSLEAQAAVLLVNLLHDMITEEHESQRLKLAIKFIQRLDAYLVEKHTPSPATPP